jgi:hypothetical protein
MNIPQEYKLTPEEIHDILVANNVITIKRDGLNAVNAIMDAAVAKAMPLIEKRAREDERKIIKNIMQEAGDLKELEKLIADYLGAVS